MFPLTLNLAPAIHLTDEQFYLLCQANGELRFEGTVEGILVIMPPTGGETGKRDGDIFGQPSTRAGYGGASVSNQFVRGKCAAWFRVGARTDLELRSKNCLII